jgi:hypothetical protein
MGFSEDMDKVSAVLNCAWKKIQGKDCWKPQYDFSPELLLGYYLGFFKGRSCKGGLCMPISNYQSEQDQIVVRDARGDGQAVIAMYAAGEIIIKIDGEPWEPKTQDEDGNDIWDPYTDAIWPLANENIGRPVWDPETKKFITPDSSSVLTIELGDLEEDKKLAAIQKYYQIVKKYGEDNIAYKFWRGMGVLWCTHEENDYKRLVDKISLPLDGIDCRSLPEVDFPKLSDKWCREKTNIKDDTQRICNTDEPVQGLGETKYREIAEWYCDKTPEDSWCRCYNATNPEKQCGGLYDQVSVVKQEDLGDTFCTEEGSIHQDVCRGLCSSPTTVSRKQPASSAAWDTPEADAIIKACSGAKLNEIWEKDGEGKRKLTSNTFTGSAGTWNVGEWAPRVSLKTRDGARCDSIKHRFEALTSAFQFPRDDVVNSLRCTHKACWAEGQQYKPKNFEEGCSGMFACGEGRASFKQSNDDVVLSCWRHRGTGEDPAEFLKKHGFGADALDPKNMANKQEKEEKKKRTKSDKLDNLANNTSLQVGTSFFSVICASCLCIVFMLNSRKK